MKPTGAAVSIGLLALTVLAAAGCGSDGLPATIVGSYARQEAEPGGLRSYRLDLNVTATGIAVTGPGMGISQSVSVGGTPVMGGSIKMGAAPGSVLFDKIKCSDESSCRFTTQSDCEGTISRDASGAIVIVAVGGCEAWSGKWTPASAADAAGSASATSSTTSTTSTTSGPAGATDPGATQAPAIPTAPSTATATSTATSTATAQPTSTATAQPTATATVGPINVSCLAACNNASFACVRECKVGDLDCMKECSAKVSTCAQKCP